MKFFLFGEHLKQTREITYTSVNKSFCAYSIIDLRMNHIHIPLELLKISYYKTKIHIIYDKFHQKYFKTPKYNGVSIRFI